MANFNQRERGFEAKYTFDLEQNFRIEACLYKMLARWAGGKMGLSDAESAAFANQVVGDVVADPKSKGIAAALLAEFGSRNIDMTVSELNAKLAELEPLARVEVLGPQD
ncbi:ATPase inhibitor subunit zeta [Thalassospira sp.]|uniref:DUF1476 domain-containing protein n=1 Tax=Thalassospira sp. TaxID=1912094 RepID=UPI0027330569|nr:ATPase inhibitor subunit zeta [Thalassospira sp.]MDP2698365.1 ATPase inhibitor subunit zeta [Thalassospira sp.]